MIKYLWAMMLLITTLFIQTTVQKLKINLSEAKTSKKILFLLAPPGLRRETLFFNQEIMACLPFIYLKTHLEKDGFLVTMDKHMLRYAKYVLVICAPNPSDIEWKQFKQKINGKKRVLLEMEPITVSHWVHDTKNHSNFDMIFTLEDNQVDNKKYFKYYYPQSILTSTEYSNFEEKKLATQICGNKNSLSPFELYSKRRNVIEFFEQNHSSDFEFYGTKWPINKYKNYRGQPKPEHKIEILGQYKFCFCYENTHSIRGYITEKIFDCMVAGSVPIYLGAPNIDTYIPLNCYIDRRKFSSNEELYRFIKIMDKITYNMYMKNIKIFLSSNQGYLFSIENFAKTIRKAFT